MYIAYILRNSNSKYLYLLGSTIILLRKLPVHQFKEKNRY